MSRGRFIVFEGGEGVGKSTQAARLADRLGGLVRTGRQNGDLTALDQYYADKFFAHMPREEWIYTLQVMQEKLGPIKSYKLLSSNLESSFFGAEKLKLTYGVEYEQVAFHHAFTVVEQNGRAKVLSHDVVADLVE